nr:MAG TPA: hypothetical protein [Caudoviricetes sp.]
MLIFSSFPFLLFAINVISYFYQHVLKTLLANNIFN